MDNYKIVSVSMGFSLSKALVKLTAEVNDAITRGWRPSGGVAVGGTHVMQAMQRDR
ncbi:MAG: hypothetical protein SynsKO_42250 [Synoicihabitans sp.]